MTDKSSDNSDPGKSGVIQMSGGRIIWIKSNKVVFCKKYVGKFIGEKLQDMADTENYYTTISGNPFVPSGSGSTPELAIMDAINRAQELTKKLQQGINALNGARQELRQKNDQPA